jgi:hypothetical protein
MGLAGGKKTNAAAGHCLKEVHFFVFLLKASQAQVRTFKESPILYF